jgi:transposase
MEITHKPLTTSREERGRAIAEKSGHIQKVKDNQYKVRSQSGNGSYVIKLTGTGLECSCPDFQNRHQPCKHIIGLRYYLEVQKDTPQGTVTEKVHLTYAQAWSAYNAAQKEEIKLFDALLKDLVKAIPEPEQKMGRPRLPLSETLFCAIQKVYSQLSSRRAHSLFQNAVERKQIDHAPYFNVTSALFNNPDITPILHELVTLSALPVAELETDFAIDSTGFRTTTFSAYNGVKHGQKKEHRWIKAHMATGVKTNIVTSIEITAENGGDSPQFKPLVQDTSKKFNIREISADRAYSSRDNLDTVGKIGGIAYIPFKKNATGRAAGSALWKKMYHYFQLNRDEFLEHYHKRSNVESTNAAIKRKFGETLKSKNHIAQVNELLAKIIAYNLTVVIHEMYENGISPDFLHVKSDVCT